MFFLFCRPPACYSRPATWSEDRDSVPFKKVHYFDIFKTCFIEKAIFLTTLFNVHVTNDNQIEKVRVVFALTQSSRS